MNKVSLQILFNEHFLFLTGFSSLAEKLEGQELLGKRNERNGKPHDTLRVPRYKGQGKGL